MKVWPLPVPILPEAAGHPPKCTDLTALLRALGCRRTLQAWLVTREPHKAQRPSLPRRPGRSPRDGEDPRRGWLWDAGRTELLWLRAQPRAPWLCARPARVRPAHSTAAPVI